MATPPAHPPYVACGHALDTTFAGVVERAARHTAAGGPPADTGSCNLCFEPDFLVGDEFGDRTVRVGLLKLTCAECCDRRMLVQAAWVT
jgi:hypothetical protein